MYEHGYVLRPYQIKVRIAEYWIIMLVPKDMYLKGFKTFILWVLTRTK